MTRRRSQRRQRRGQYGLRRIKSFVFVNLMLEYRPVDLDLPSFAYDTQVYLCDEATTQSKKAEIEARRWETETKIQEKLETSRAQLASIDKWIETYEAALKVDELERAMDESSSSSDEESDCLSLKALMAKHYSHQRAGVNGVGSGIGRAAAAPASASGISRRPARANRKT